MSGCHPTEEPKLLQDLRIILDDILSLTMQLQGLDEKICEHWELNYKGQVNISKRINALEDIRAETRLLRIETCFKTVLESGKRTGFSNDKAKKPHKCPVCDGKPNLPLQFRDKNNEHIEFIADCHACEGSGVIWG